MFSFYLTGFKKILDLGKKIFIVLAVYFIVISLFFHFIAKDKPKITYDPIKKNREEIYKAINDPQLNKTQEGKLAIAIYQSILCGAIGEACTDNPSDGDKNFSHSLFGFISNLIVLPYTNPPASGIYWAYDSLQNASFAPKTYAAQGIGFASIKPLMSIWKIFRDIAYMLLVLVLIAIGFMIMFRAKINPQTVISIENSLPKIVIALLLITFSFPIAGFLIDLMYITIGIIAVIFSNLAGTGLGENLDKADKIDKLLDYFYFSKSIRLWNLISPLNKLNDLWKLADSIYGILPTILKGIFTTFILITLPPTKIISIIFHFLKLPTNLSGLSFLFKKLPIINKGLNDAGAGTPIISIIIAIFLFILNIIILLLFQKYIGILIILLILSLSLIYMFFRIFFLILYTYIQILILIIFSPVILMIEMIPGKSTFSSWAKNLILNLATWPILITLILIVNVLLNQSPSEATNLWAPPFLSSINPEYFKIIISMGILFVIPDLIKNFKQLSGVKPMPIGIDFGAFTAGASIPIGASLGMMSQFYTLGQFFGEGGIGGKLLRGRIKETKKTFQKTGTQTGGSSGTVPEG